MTVHAPAPLLNHITAWPENARSALWQCREIFHRIAEDARLGPLDETLKWGQPSWRPVRPRTGSTLRMGWSAASPDHLALFVDCKTDLAARMQDIHPDLPINDGQRQLGVDLATPLPEQAISHLAEMTFTYHLARRRSAN